MNLIINILIILFLIILLILILLCVPATLYIEKNQGEKLKLKVSYLFIKKDLLKISKNKKKDKEVKKEIKEKEKLPFSKKISSYCFIIREGLKEVNYILSKTKIKNLYLKIICAEGDAAFRAVSFGVISSAVYPLLGIIESKTQVADGAFNLDIRCDYNAKKSEYAFNVTIKLSLIFAIIGGLKFYINMKNHKYNE